MTALKLTRTCIVFGLVAVVFVLVSSPGLATALATVSYIGWLREHTLHDAARARLRSAALELEAAAVRQSAFDAILEKCIVTRVEYKLANFEGTVH